MVNSHCFAISGIRNGGKVNVWPRAVTFLELNGYGKMSSGAVV